MNNWLECMDVCGFYLFDCKKKEYNKRKNREGKTEKKKKTQNYPNITHQFVQYFI